MTDSALCLVCMPRGLQRAAGAGPAVDFEQLFATALEPAVRAAGMNPHRPSPGFGANGRSLPPPDQLTLAEFAVADIGFAQAQDCYLLGARLARRPASTLLLCADGVSPPFDPRGPDVIAYRCGPEGAIAPGEARRLQQAITGFLQDAQRATRYPGSAGDPLYDLLAECGAAPIARLKTDVFRDRVTRPDAVAQALAEARERGDQRAMEDLERDLGDLAGVDYGVLIDLLLSYRAISAWDAMVTLVQRLPPSLGQTVLVREQLAYALNRRGQKEQALAVLDGVLQRQGPGSETCALRGRIYKDLWAAAREAGDAGDGGHHLDQAIAAYLRGFEADSRDAFPGINALTLMELRGDAGDARRVQELLPVVRYAVARRLESGAGDYWDRATLLELAVLARSREDAAGALRGALDRVRETWEPQSTANNLRLIGSVWRERQDNRGWLDSIIEALDQAAAG